MAMLYLTADQVSAPSGGGRVTQEESTALFDFATEQGEGFDCWDRKVLEGPGDDPWKWDEQALRLLENRTYFGQGFYDLCHVYAGTFSQTIDRLKKSGCKISYMAAAHNVYLSAKAHRDLGLDFPYRHLTDPQLWQRYLAGYLAADVVICPSQHSANTKRDYGCKNIEIIPHGVDIPAEPLPPKNNKIPFVVGYLGSLGPDKGVIYLLRAWAKLNYSDAWLLIGGRDSQGPMFSYLLSLAGNGLRNVAPLGWLEHPSELYKQIDLYVQPSVCLLPGSLVFSKRGPVPIDELNDQDQVLVNNGHYRNVIKPLRRSYSGELMSVKTTRVGESVAMTSTHRLLVIKRGLSTRAEVFQQRGELYEEALRLRSEKGLGSLRISKIVGAHPQTIEAWFRGTKPHDGHSGALRSLRQDVLEKQPEWIHAKDLERGDVLLFPRIKQTIPRETVNLPKKKIGSRSNRIKILPDRLVLDTSAMQFFGYYVAEACNTGTSVVFCFHCDETEYINEVSEFLKYRLGLNPKVSYHKHKNSATVRAESILLARFLGRHFGKGAHNKTFPTWSLLLPDEQLIPLVRGAWRGDGTCWLVEAKRRGVSYSTVSKSLAYQMFAALVRLGFMPKLSPQKIGYLVTCNGNDSLRFAETVLGLKVESEKGRRGTRTYIDEHYYYMPVVDISRIAYQGEVFNLEVEGKHNYCAPFVVHNSEGFGIEILEAMAHNRAVLCSTGAGAADVVPETWRFPAENVDALADKIDQFRKADLQLIGSVGRGLAQEYSWEKIRARYADLWRRLLGQP